MTSDLGYLRQQMVGSQSVSYHSQPKQPELGCYKNVTHNNVTMLLCYTDCYTECNNDGQPVARILQAMLLLTARAMECDIL